MKLNLACGKDKREGYVNVDVNVECGPDFTINLLAPGVWLRWEENSIEEIQVRHFLEHIPHLMETATARWKDPMVNLMERCYHILQPGGKMVVAFPHHQSSAAFDDPTHCRFITTNTMRYFDALWRVQAGVSHYDINTDLEIVDGNRKVYKTYADLGEEAVKRLEWGAWNVVYEVELTLVAHKPKRTHGHTAG